MIKRNYCNFHLLFFLSMILGCDESNNKKLDKGSLEKELDYPMESVMINKTQCELNGEFKDLSIEDIIGTWKDTLFWKMQPNDSCYYGINELNVEVELKLNPTKTFCLTSKFSRSEFEEIDMGEFFLSYDGSITTLVLAKNPKGEVLFGQGDTMKNSTIYHLYWIDSNTLILDSQIKKGNYLLREGIECKRVKKL